MGRYQQGLHSILEDRDLTSCAKHHLGWKKMFGITHLGSSLIPIWSWRTSNLPLPSKDGTPIQAEVVHHRQSAGHDKFGEQAPVIFLYRFSPQGCLHGQVKLQLRCQLEQLRDEA
jgi:hypothetical protein